MIDKYQLPFAFRQIGSFLRASGLFLSIALLAACGVQSLPATETPTHPPNNLPAVTNTPTAPPPPTSTPEASFTLIPEGEIASAEAPVVCENNAEFVTDLTVPDFSEFGAGQLIDKQWQVRNTGNCDWDASYRLVFSEGAQMSAAPEQAVYPARAGELAILRVKGYAPDLPGDYRGYWQLVDERNNAFGTRLYVQIRVR